MIRLFRNLSPALALGALIACEERPAADRVDRPAAPAPAAATPALEAPMPPAKQPERIVKTDDEWRKILTPEQFRIMREKGTERAFTGKYWNTTDAGVYRCAGCGQELFASDSKFDSHCGWPSFDRSQHAAAIDEHVDTSFGMIRTEVTCSRCGAHLGHLFDDGPTDTGMRYCINSASIDLQRAESPATPPQKP